MIIDIITIFPKMFAPVTGESIIKRAQQKGLVKIRVHDLRDYTSDPHQKVDSPSYGGRGMVFRVEPLFTVVEKLVGHSCYPREKKDKDTRIILLSPQGVPLKQKRVRNYLKYERLIVIAPRYEGVDERVRKYLIDEEVSIGDYIVSGGELPAMVLVDSVVRLIPGVVSDQESVTKESFEQTYLDCPHYTRPENFRGLTVPKILLSGNHQKIAEWRNKKAIENTKKHRPDLIKESESPR